MSSGQVLLAITIYALIMIYVGFRAFKRTTTATADYFLANRTVGLAAMFFTVSFTILSAFALFGTVSAFYGLGVGFWGIMVGTAFGLGLAYFVGVPANRLSHRLGYGNITDHMGGRYQSAGLYYLMSVVMLVFLIPIVAIQVRAAGLMLEGLTDGALPFAVGVGYIVILMLVYVVFGGMRGVVWTDVIQGVVLSVGLVIAAIWIIGDAGGLPAIFNKVAAIKPKVLGMPGPIGRYGAPGLLSQAILFAIVPMSLLPHIYQRFQAARSESVVKNSFLLWVITGTIVWLLTMFIAFAGIVKFPDLRQADALFPMLMAKAPAALRISLLLTGLAAMMSTADSILLSMSHIASDAYRRLTGVEDQAKLVTVGRVMVVVAVVASTLTALYAPQDLVGLMNNLGYPGVLVIFPTLIGGLYWRRSTAAGAITSIVVGLVITFGLTLGNVPLGGWAPAMLGLLGSIVSFVGVSLASASPAESVIRQHEDAALTPIEDEPERRTAAAAS